MGNLINITIKTYTLTTEPLENPKELTLAVSAGAQSVAGDINTRHTFAHPIQMMVMTAVARRDYNYSQPFVLPDRRSESHS